MDEPACYEIRVAEHLDTRLAKWFDGLEINHAADSDETIFRGEMADQPALFGALGKIRDFGLTLISVQRLERAAVGPCAFKTGPNTKDKSNERR